jgi:hypothetical protein
MGEIADMMINGQMCAFCGVWLGLDDEPGFPVYCSIECREEHNVDPEGVIVDALKSDDS